MHKNNDRSLEKLEELETVLTQVEAKINKTLEENGQHFDAYVTHILNAFPTEEVFSARLNVRRKDLINDAEEQKRALVLVVDAFLQNLKKTFVQYKTQLVAKCISFRDKLAVKAEMKNVAGDISELFQTLPKQFCRFRVDYASFGRVICSFHAVMNFAFHRIYTDIAKRFNRLHLSGNMYTPISLGTLDKYEMLFLSKRRLFYYTKCKDSRSLDMHVVSLGYTSMSSNNELASRTVRASKYGYCSKFIASNDHIARLYVDDACIFHLQLFDAGTLSLLRRCTLKKCLQPYCMNERDIVLYSYSTFSYIVFDYELRHVENFILTNEAAGKGDSALSFVDASLLALDVDWIYAAYYPSRVCVLSRHDPRVMLRHIDLGNEVRSHITKNLVTVNCERKSVMIKEEYRDVIRWYDLTNGTWKCTKHHLRPVKYTTLIHMSERDGDIWCLDAHKNELIFI